MADNLEQMLTDFSPVRWKFTDEPGTEGARAFEAYWSNKEINRLIEDFKSAKYKVYVVHSGRRSFKSETAKRLLVWYCLTHRDKKVLFTAPTARQATEIAWEDVIAMVPKFFVQQVKLADQVIVLKNNTRISFYSLDEPRRIEGRKIDGIVIDECANIPDGAWFQNILPGISDQENSWALLVSTPEGRTGDLWKIYEAAMSNPEGFKQYGFYHWHRGHLLGDEWLNQFRSQVSAEIFRQEWLGEFVTGQGLAYSAFERDKHVNEFIPFSPMLPIDICCDWNVHILPWPICQSSLATTNVLDEVVGRECSAENMCRMVKERVSALLNNTTTAKNHPIRFFGDASAGYIRDPSAHQTAWNIVRNEFMDWNVSFKIGRKNPRIGDRIALVNSRLKTADGVIHTQVSPKAKELIMDFETISYEDIMKGEKTRMGEERSHSVDGYGYYIYHISYSDLRQQVGMRNI